MVSVAAAMAKEGLETWVYSIAPFCYARSFEQIRNDIAFHGLPVKLIGNGGGYGYGVMGPTHHAIEDYGVLLTLPAMRVFTPVFDEDISEVVRRVGESASVGYLRLGRGEPPYGFEVPAYAPWRQLTDGPGMPVIAVGPLAGTYIEAFEKLGPEERPNLWALAELPMELDQAPVRLMAQIAASGAVCVVEEHVQQGGVAAQLALQMASTGRPVTVRSLHARAHNYGRYGSQRFMRERSGLAPERVLECLLGESRPHGHA